MARLCALTCRTALLCAVAALAGVDPASAAPPLRMVDLGAFRGYSTTARGINDAGEIVGEKYHFINEDSFESHGLLWRRGASGQYSWTEIGELAEFPNSYPRSINNSGRIAGYAEVVDFAVMGPPVQVVMWEKDPSGGGYAPTDLGTPYSFRYSEALGYNVLNEAGQIVGSARAYAGAQHAYLWAEPGLAPPVDLSPAAGDFEARGVSEAGFVVGASVPQQRPILWRKDVGGYTQVELPMPPGATRGTAYDINDEGQIVGVVNTPPPAPATVAVIWEKSALGAYEPHALALPPGGLNGSAHAINGSGEVVGRVVFNESGRMVGRAVLWREDPPGQLTPALLDELPGTTASAAYGVNDRGQIVGSASILDTATSTVLGHAVLWERPDETPPTIGDVSAFPAVLWPPNRELVDVTIGYQATDDSGSVACRLGPVTCNETTTAADWLVLDDHRIQLRSERHGKGSGRLYAVPIECRDPSGNVASQVVAVAVPHDRRR